MQSSSDAVVVLLFQDFIPECSTGGSQHFGDSGRAESGCYEITKKAVAMFHNHSNSYGILEIPP